MAIMKTKMMTVSLKNDDNTATRCGNGAQPHRELNRATGKGTCLGGPVLYIYILYMYCVYIVCILYMYCVYCMYILYIIYIPCLGTCLGGPAPPGRTQLPEDREAIP